jgi:hypothetical protein
MHMRDCLGIAPIAMLSLGGGTACAGELRQIGTIAIPGQPLTHFDISFVDQDTAQYFLADRSNKAVDIFDAKSDRYIGRVGTFVGAVSKDGQIDNDVSGPDGVVTVGQQLWAGDGDSTVKIIDLPTGKTVAMVPTGGKTRVDELAIDPKDHVFIGVDNAEDPPFATLISTEPDHNIVGRVVFPVATDGADSRPTIPMTTSSI